ncbi:Adenosylcobinamide-phosphate synthase [hydrothermal vent metagenome]|uniref:Adenosylcobinamide-phosphate synthase n=1 Tax=hydrothermal vent metagenome TaxID=652676 RepID=A0A3B1BPH2_9ZZZZ
MTTLLITLLAALLLDRLLGEPRRAHPLIAFGRLVQWLEARLSDAGNASILGQRLRGSLAVVLLLIPLTVLVWVLGQWHEIALLLNVLILYLAVGGRSLVEHAGRVRDALQEKNMQLARTRTSYLVSRDTGHMNAQEMARATIESILENGCDALFAPLFWFLLAGAPGVLFYRLANTLDAMWGYKTPRYRDFGWAAARLDDVLNFIPARLTALSYAVAGRFVSAIQCWFSQAGACASPNAGPVMAAGAGALALQLGGPAVYHGQVEARPQLGLGSLPAAEDIDQAVNLLRRSLGLWLGLLALVWGGLQFA